MPETDMNQEKFKQACENHRFFGDMRFKQLTLFTAAMAALLTVLLSKQFEVSHLARIVLSVIGLGFTGVLWVMEVRSSIHGDKTSSLIEALGGEEQYFGTWPQPFNATNVVFALYLFSYVGWAIFLGTIAKSVWTRASLIIGTLFGMLLLAYTIREYLSMWRHRAGASGAGEKRMDPQKPWNQWTDSQLTVEAQQGLRGEGAVVEMMRRVKDSNKLLTWVNVALTLAALFVGIVQIWKR